MFPPKIISVPRPRYAPTPAHRGTFRATRAFVPLLAKRWQPATPSAAWPAATCILQAAGHRWQSTLHRIRPAAHCSTGGYRWRASMRAYTSASWQRARLLRTFTFKPAAPSLPSHAATMHHTARLRAATTARRSVTSRQRCTQLPLPRHHAASA
jgi:hypothetical protein